MRSQILRVILICLFNAAGIVVTLGQSISPAPGNTTVCPGEYYYYTYSTGSGSCPGSPVTVIWHITNGYFDNDTNLVTKTVSYGTQMTVTWSDVSGNGTLKATPSCNSALEVTNSYAIRSLKNVSPVKAMEQSLSYCQTQAIVLSVQVLYLPNTGGGTSFTQIAADGYEWTVPSGWTGASSLEAIVLTPTDGCSGGSAKVKAYVSCSSGRKYSNEVTFNLEKSTPSLSVTASGYGGAYCGNTQSVTFSVTPAPNCLRTSPEPGYQWSAPPGWYNESQSGSVFYTSTPYITLRPSGTGSDSGDILCTAVLNCGKTIGATPFHINYASPVIQSPSAICSGGNAVSLSNVSTTSSITAIWSTSSNITIASGQGTLNPTLQATGTGLGTIDVTVSCADSPVAQKSVFVGTPDPIMILGDNFINPGQEKYFEMSPYLNGGPTYHPSFAEQGITGYEWAFLLNTSPGWQYFNGNYIGTWAMADNNSQMLMARSQNGCGYSDYAYHEIWVNNPDCPRATCEQPFVVYPNPSEDDLFIKIRRKQPLPPENSSVVGNDGVTSAQSLQLQQSPDAINKSVGSIDESKSKDYFLKRLDDENNQKSHVIIYDSNGAEVLNVGHEGLENKISLRGLKNGTYYLRLQKDGKWYEQKIVVNH